MRVRIPYYFKTRTERQEYEDISNGPSQVLNLMVEQSLLGV